MKQSKPDRRRQMGWEEITYCITHIKTSLTTVYDSICCIVCVRIVVICRGKAQRVIKIQVYKVFIAQRVKKCVVSPLGRTAPSVSLDTVSYKVISNSDQLFTAG